MYSSKAAGLLLLGLSDDFIPLFYSEVASQKAFLQVIAKLFVYSFMAYYV